MYGFWGGGTKLKVQGTTKDSYPVNECIYTYVYIYVYLCQIDGVQLDEGLETRPSLGLLLIGRKDDWMKQYRGEEAINYIRYIKV